jgi:hypothetical protein
VVSAAAAVAAFMHCSPPGSRYHCVQPLLAMLLLLLQLMLHGVKPELRKTAA